MWDGAGGQCCRERGFTGSLELRVTCTGLSALPFPLAAACVMLESWSVGLGAFLQFPG